MQAHIIIPVLFACATDVWCSRHEYLDNDMKIVGGYNDTVENNPYIVHLSLTTEAPKKYIICGGSIISENYILTAAHCTIGVVKATIRAGSTEADSGGHIYTSESITKHPSYDPNNIDNDVAVIRTTQPIRLDGVKTKAVKLPKQESDVSSGTNIKVSGWGDTREDGIASPNLMSVIVPALSNEACSQQLGHTITECQFCAGVPEGGKDSCQSDSGGPAVRSASTLSNFTPKTCSSQTWEQIGIVSWGEGCARPGKPGVYTKVSCASVRSWIKLITGV